MKQNLQTPYTKTKQKIHGPYTQIYLVRHCKPDYSQKEIVGDAKMPLSRVGKKQRALLTNKKLSKLRPNVVFASQFTRAQETAEVYLKKTKKTLVVDKRFNEIDWEEWYKIKYFNMSEKTRIKRVKEYQEMDARLHRLHTKFRRIIADIYRTHKGKTVLIFCHGNVIRSILTGILNTDVIGFLSLEVYQSSVSKIAIDKNGYIKINYINNIGHLPKKPKEDLFQAAINQ
jgi:broad specificity phosphatase PhoE